LAEKISDDVKLSFEELTNNLVTSISYHVSVRGIAEFSESVVARNLKSQKLSINFIAAFLNPNTN